MNYTLLAQPLEDCQRTDTAWLKSTLREINHQLKDTDKKLLALKSSIDEAKVCIKSHNSQLPFSLHLLELSKANSFNFRVITAMFMMSENLELI